MPVKPVFTEKQRRTLNPFNSQKGNQWLDNLQAGAEASSKNAEGAADRVWDPTTQSWQSLGDTDPGSEAGRYALTRGLNDPNSAASKQFYYGGSKDAANQQYNALQAKANQLENRAPLTSDFGDYSQTFEKQDQLNRRLQGIQNGTVTTPGQDQLRAAYGQNQANLNAQLASTQGGLVAAAAARNAARTASENGMRTYGRDAAIMRANDALQAQGQQAGLLNAMRTGEQNAAFLDAERNQEAKMQNLNTGAAVSKFGLASLQQGLQGNINRERARNQAYANAVGISQQQNKFNSEIENQNLNTTLGSFEAAGMATGKLVSGYADEDKKQKQTSDSDGFKRMP